WRRAIVPTSAFPAMFERHLDLVAGFDDETLLKRLAENTELMENYAVLAFYRAATALPGGAPDESRTINPHALSLDPHPWEADGRCRGEGISVADARQTPAAGMENLFMEAIATPA